ncbi:MAG: ketopantoate reductase family protein [Syntrophomonadaceae bacterium]|nr:ketopantoate reductase family protein [Syntrophomonadaceae bacterium]
MRMAIMGAGSLGTIIGALLTKNGYETDLIDSNVQHVEALNKSGAKIIGLMDLVQPVKALTPDQMTGEYDLYFYLVKSTQHDQALQHVVKHLKPDGVVLAMQNGIPENAVAAVVGKERTAGCIVGWGATWMEPGVSKLTSTPDHMSYDVGEMDGKDTARVNEIVKILSAAGIPEKTTNLMGIRWTKLTINSSFSTMSAVVAGTYGDVLDNPKALTCAAHIWQEALAVAKAAGVSPEPLQGFDIRQLDFETQKERAEKLPLFSKLLTPHRSIKTGILFDIEAGRMPEIETAYNGIICEWGEKYGVQTPVNKQVLDIVKGMANGEYKIEPANVDRVKIPDFPA